MEPPRWCPTDKLDVSHGSEPRSTGAIVPAYSSVNKSTTNSTIKAVTATRVVKLSSLKPGTTMPIARLCFCAMRTDSPAHQFLPASVARCRFGGSLASCSPARQFLPASVARCRFGGSLASCSPARQFLPASVARCRFGGSLASWVPPPSARTRARDQGDPTVEPMGFSKFHREVEPMCRDRL
jgi:hypothetical protein